MPPSSRRFFCSRLLDYFSRSVRHRLRGSRPLETGITVPDIGTPSQLGFDRIKQTGASSTRVIVYWSSVAPSFKPGSWDPTDPGDSHYNWAAYDSQIQSAVSAGLDPLVVVYSAPRWAERCQDDIGGICNPDQTRSLNSQRPLRNATTEIS